MPPTLTLAPAPGVPEAGEVVGRVEACLTARTVVQLACLTVLKATFRKWTEKIWSFDRWVLSD